MITLRHEQLETLRQPESEPFERQLCEELERSHPEQIAALGPEGTRALVRHGLRTGWRHGIDNEDALARLVVLMVQLGRDFERSPDRMRALARLHHPRLPGPVKIDLVTRILNARTGGRVVVPAGRKSA